MADEKALVPLRGTNGKIIAGGRSLNPHGRRPLPKWFKDKGPEALQHLLDVALGIHTEGIDGKTRLRAAEIVVERVYGKPMTPHDVDVTGIVSVASVVRRIVDPRDSRPVIDAEPAE
jgi:hypothetical protein